MRGIISIAGPGREGMESRPGGCFRESDTNTVLAGALVPSEYVPLAEL